MLFRQIKYFIAIVEYNSFTEAANQCFISQSAISQQMSVLEEELGVKLTQKEGRGFSLTPAGEFFYQRSKLILKIVEKLKSEIKQVNSIKQIHLNIGYLASYDGEELQKAIIEYSKIYPDVLVHVYKGTHEDLYNLLKNEEATLVLNDQRRAFSNEYENYILNQSPAYIDVLETHPLASKNKVTTMELENYPCILVASKNRETTEKDYYENTLEIGKHFIVVESLDEAKLLTMSGRGYLLVESVKNKVAAPLVRLEVRRNDESAIVRTYCAFWKKVKTNFYIEEFAKILRKFFVK